jgi:hypothetical protein
MHMTTRFWVGSLATVLTLTLACGSASAALTGQYLFEEGSGTTAGDTSGFMRDGTLTGTTGTPDWVSGIYAGSNNALRFNYNTETMAYDNALLHRVALPINTDFVRNAPAITLMAWVRPDQLTNQGGLSGSYRSIVGVSESAGGTRGILQINAANGHMRVLGRRVDGGGNANFLTAAPTTPITAGSTHFLVGIIDYVNTTMSIYLDGVLQTGGASGGVANLGTAGPTNLSVDAPNAAAFIGTNTAGAGEQFNGLIDGVRIFDHAVSAEVILNTYNAEKLAVNDANFDNDNAVNGSDLMIWQRGLGNGTTNAQGDANGDGAVNNADLTIWKGAFGPASVSAASAVPEPASATLAAILGLALAARRRR